MSAPRKELITPEGNEFLTVITAGGISAVLLYGLDGVIARLNYGTNLSAHVFHPRNAFQSSVSSSISLVAVWGAKPYVEKIAKQNNVPCPEVFATTTLVGLSLLACQPISLSLNMNNTVNQPLPMRYRFKQLYTAFGPRGLYLSMIATTARNGFDANLMFNLKEKTLPAYLNSPFMINVVSGMLGGFICHPFNVLSVRIRKDGFERIIAAPGQKLPRPSTRKEFVSLLKTPSALFKKEPLAATVIRSTAATLLMSYLPTFIADKKEQHKSEQSELTDEKFISCSPL